MAKTIDLELKKAFTELQEKMIETSQKLRIADIQIENLKKSKQHSEITEREISSLAPGTKTYESIGRMFLLNDIDNVKKNLQMKQKSAADKIETLVNTKIYLEKNLKDSENNLREMVQNRKEQDKS
ncbi:prefoldin subunit 1 [Ctenocephalides felis]|uniref:prefoldin subunit 1 n=1 Tax=Ctenocephalides felis TaxID=7515 RepID=UPI000E6E3D6A|nr:prefoldin subunit 1 [Ctenocephalides felis]